MDIFIHARGQELTVAPCGAYPVIPQSGFTRFIFVLPKEWDGMDIYMQIANEYDLTEYYLVDLDENRCAVMPEVSAGGYYTLTVCGKKTIGTGDNESKIIATTNFVRLKVDEVDIK